MLLPLTAPETSRFKGNIDGLHTTADSSHILLANLRIFDQFSYS